MRKKDALKTPRPQQDSQPKAKMEARVGRASGYQSARERLYEFASSRRDPANDRLLLYEVLLEEYESMDRSQLNDAAIEEIASEIQDIRDEGKECKKRCRGLPEDERDKDEEEFNGRLTKKVYDMLRNAQTYPATTRRADVEELCANITNDSDHRRTVRRLIRKDIYGELEAERKKLREKLKDLVAEEELEGRVEEQIVADVYGAILEEKRVAEQEREQAGHRKESSQGADDKAKPEDRLKRLETLDAQTQRSALCLSGGGIRSATFNLGILQGLARYGLLGQFDYLSTVSGGGFVGGWLSAWIQRKGLTKVMEGLSVTPDSPLKPEAAPITHLRNFSNFLSPKLGLLYADTWTLLATLLRNMLLTWLVFVPFLISVLMLPRLVIAFIHRASLDNRTSPGAIARVSGSLTWWFGFSDAEMLSMVVGFLAGWLYLSYIGVHLPSTRDKDNREASFFKWCLLPMVISAIAFSMFWLRLKQRGGWLSVREVGFFGWKIALAPWFAFVIFGVVLIAVPWFMSIISRFKRVGQHNFWEFVGGSGLATLLIGFAQVVNGFLLWYFATEFFHIEGADYDTRLYTIFAVPILLAIWSLSGILMAGFTSRYTLDEDQEWWARAGAWIMITIVAWIAVNSLVLYGPDLFDSLTRKLQDPLSPEPLSWSDKYKIAVGIFSVAAALLGGFSSRTPANSQQAKEAGLKAKVSNILVSVLAFIAMAFLLILIVIFTNIILTSNLGAAVNRRLAYSASLAYTITDHKNIIFNSASWYLIIVMALIALLSVLMGWLINTNRFSLHYMWRDRIIRAYLGASREERNPNMFTGFDTCDNTPMYKLRPDQPGAPETIPNCPESYPPDHSKKLLHVLNIALNLTGSNKLAWQDRKSESFTVSPLHCGSYWLGYRKSWRYGGIDDDSISLGTAVAISCAFVSPNMGYMMTSPVLRFLMALFNVRFGWWLGNPGRAGESNTSSDSIRASIRQTYNLNSPRLSVRPIVKEAFGLINDKSDYIYLSDGGHFENLGIYEMVVRRCRFIVVSDASTDANYAFDSLALSIRQIRVDLGVPIEMRDFSIFSQSQDLKGKYCSIGTIRYSCVDGGSADERDGVLIYIKAALIGAEPRDVLNYYKESGDFPQEVIVDQWFSEAQFESYRALGSHIIRAICGEDEKPLNLATLLRKVQEHIRLNYDVFDEQISYAAFEHLFKEELLSHAPETFKAKVLERISKNLGDKET